MGMYDSVFVDCPDCGTSMEFQTKMGRCVLGSYSIHNAPGDVLLGVIGDKGWCQNKECGTIIRIIAEINAWVERVDGNSSSTRRIVGREDDDTSY